MLLWRRPIDDDKQLLNSVSILRNIEHFLIGLAIHLKIFFVQPGEVHGKKNLTDSHLHYLDVSAQERFSSQLFDLADVGSAWKLANIRLV